MKKPETAAPTLNQIIHEAKRKMVVDMAKGMDSDIEWIKHQDEFGWYIDPADENRAIDRRVKLTDNELQAKWGRKRSLDRLLKKIVRRIENRYHYLRDPALRGGNFGGRKSGYLELH